MLDWKIIISLKIEFFMEIKWISLSRVRSSHLENKVKNKNNRSLKLNWQKMKVLLKKLILTKKTTIHYETKKNYNLFK